MTITSVVPITVTGIGTTEYTGPPSPAKPCVCAGPGSRRAMAGADLSRGCAHARAIRRVG
jgi:hypothetical protein